MKRVENAVVLKNDRISENIFAITLRLPEVAGQCLPGQFVMLYLDRGEMLLPRPISICDADRDAGSITLVYQVVGGGTKHLSSFSPGAALRALGPLGNGFTIKEGLKAAVLVGGAAGVAPLLLLLRELAQRGVKASAVLGFRDSAILTRAFESHGAHVYISTDSGKEGFRGNAIDLLREKNLAPDEFFACGPEVMLHHLARYAEEKGIPCQVCLEERMACGIGACLGCVTKSAAEEQPQYKKICCEGPVFYSDAVVLDG